MLPFAFPSLFQREGRERQKIFEAIKSAKAELVASLSRPQACGTRRYRKVRLIRKNPFYLSKQVLEI